jgi:hypothetical protein
VPHILKGFQVFNIGSWPLCLASQPTTALNLTPLSLVQSRKHDMGARIPRQHPTMNFTSENIR